MDVMSCRVSKTLKRSLDDPFGFAEDLGTGKISWCRKIGRFAASTMIMGLAFLGSFLFTEQDDEHRRILVTTSVFFDMIHLLE